MKVELGTFARWSIENRLGSNLRVAVLTALHHYVRRLKSGWRPAFPPSFCVERGAVAVADSTFELQVGPGMRATLEREAETHRVPLNLVLTHAVFVYLADLEFADRNGPPSAVLN